MRSMPDLEKWRFIESDSRMKDGKLNSSRIATSPPKIISNTSIVSSSSDSLKKSRDFQRFDTQDREFLAILEKLSNL